MRDSIRQFSLDANVIVRFLMQDEPTHLARAREVMRAIQDGEIAAHLDPVVLSEIVFVMKSFYRMPLAYIASGLLAILAHDGIVVPDKARYIDALTLFGSGVPHFGDACACAMALRQCDGRLLSFDRKLSRVPGIARAETL